MKQTINLLSSFMVIAVLSFSVISFTSCGDDEVEGLDRDALLGTYNGSVDCAAALAVANSDSLVFIISEGLEGDNTINTQLTDSVLAFPIPGTVDGNQIAFDVEDLGPFPFDIGGGVMLSSTITMTGTGIFNSSDGTMSAVLNITLNSADTGMELTSDNCTISGVKQ